MVQVPTVLTSQELMLLLVHSQGNHKPTVCYIQLKKHQNGVCCFRVKELTVFQLILASPFIGSDLGLPELSDSVSFLY